MAGKCTSPLKVQPSPYLQTSFQVISGSRNKSTITRTTDFGRSPISDIFGGKLRLKVHREGDHSSENIEPFFTLKLSIEVKKRHLSCLLQQYFYDIYLQKASSVKEALEILGKTIGNKKKWF